jgi:trk system potassium uptake protein TrkH
LLLIQIGGRIHDGSHYFRSHDGQENRFSQTPHLTGSAEKARYEGVVNLVLKIVTLTFIIECLGFVILSFRFVPE